MTKSFWRTLQWVCEARGISTSKFMIQRFCKMLLSKTVAALTVCFGCFKQPNRFWEVALLQVIHPAYAKEVIGNAWSFESSNIHRPGLTHAADLPCLWSSGWVSEEPISLRLVSFRNLMGDALLAYKTVPQLLLYLLCLSFLRWISMLEFFFDYVWRAPSIAAVQGIHAGFLWDPFFCISITRPDSWYWMVRLEKYVSVEYNSCKLKNLSFAWGTYDCNQAIRDIEVFGESPGLHNVAVDVRRWLRK
jgi:hypothetical protein